MASVSLIEVATKFDSCYILQEEPWSIRGEPRQDYMKGIPVNPQHSTAHDPSLCFSLFFRQMPKSLFFWASFSEGKLYPSGCQCHHWPPVLPCHSIPSLLFLRMHFILLSAPSLFSLDHGALGSLGAVCGLVAQDQFILPCEMGYSDLLCVRWSPSLANVCVGDQEPVSRGGGWYVAGGETSMSLCETIERWYQISIKRPRAIVCS